jgi:predicted lipoprotein
MRRRTVLMLLPASTTTRSAAVAAWAQPDWRRVAVPYVTPQAWLQSLHARWYVPRAREFADAARSLVQAQGRVCASGSLTEARAAWRRAMTAWERLSAVSIGPLIERRSARRIDFTPTRPASIERAIAAGASDLQLVGAPAKGLPALEWLLWKHELSAGSPACAYARRVAGEIEDEASALIEAFTALPKPDDETATAAAHAEVVNQLVAGVELLRWGQIERPLREGKRQFPRAMSGSSAAAWAARWDALRRLADHQAGAPEGPISLEMVLRGRGLNALADDLGVAVRRSDAALRGASPSRAASLQRAARDLAVLKRRLEADIAPALEVPIGFSDADGD